MPYVKRNIKYLVILFLLGVILFLIYQYFNSKTFNYFRTADDDTLPVPIINWVPYLSEAGFSFMHPANSKIEIKENLIKVAGISLKIEKLSCKNPIPSKKILSETKFYGFKAQINEALKNAYICNNTNTACLDIYQEENKTKITQGFFHSFISSLNINKNFDEISCI